MNRKITAAMLIALSMFAAGARAQDDATGTPLEGVTQEMKLAANQLSKKVTDKPTQQPQSDAITKLDSLIASLEKERNNLGNGVSARPVRPANQSDIRQGPGGMGDLHSAKEQGNRWGDLPAHERDRILQSLTEGFPAHYQSILEAYYKRLATEKRAENTESISVESKPEKAMNAPVKAGEKPKTEDKAKMTKPSTVESSAPAMKKGTP